MTAYERGRVNQRVAQVAARWRRVHWRDLPAAPDRDVSGWVAIGALIGAGVCAFLVGLGAL